MRQLHMADRTVVTSLNLEAVLFCKFTIGREPFKIPCAPEQFWKERHFGTASFKALKICFVIVRVSKNLMWTLVSISDDIPWRYFSGENIALQRLAACNSRLYRTYRMLQFFRFLFLELSISDNFIVTWCFATVLSYTGSWISLSSSRCCWF